MGLGRNKISRKYITRWFIHCIQFAAFSNLRSRSAVRTKENVAKILRDCVCSSSGCRQNETRGVSSETKSQPSELVVLRSRAPTHVVKMKTEVCAGRYFSRQQSILFIEPSVPTRDNQLGSKELYRCMYAPYIARGADLYILFIAHSPAIIVRAYI